VAVAANQDYYVGFNTIFFQIYSDVTLVSPEDAHVVSLMCTSVRFRLISITRLSLPYWKPCINFNLVMTSCEYARNSVLKSSMNQTSRTFSCRPSYLLPHFYLMRVSSTSVNTFFDIIGKDPMFAWDVAMVDGQLCRDIVEAARQWFEQNARWVRLNGMGHSPAKSSLVAWYGLELIQISYLAVATVIIRVFFQ
jgi:hypothetical protein